MWIIASCCTKWSPTECGLLQVSVRKDPTECGLLRVKLRKDRDRRWIIASGPIVQVKNRFWATNKRRCFLVESEDQRGTSEE